MAEAGVEQLQVVAVGASPPPNAKSCEPEGPQDLTKLWSHPTASAVKQPGSSYSESVMVSADTG